MICLYVCFSQKGKLTCLLLWRGIESFSHDSVFFRQTVVYMHVYVKPHKSYAEERRIWGWFPFVFSFAFLDSLGIMMWICTRPALEAGDKSVPVQCVIQLLFQSLPIFESWLPRQSCFPRIHRATLQAASILTSSPVALPLCLMRDGSRNNQTMQINVAILFAHVTPDSSVRVSPAAKIEELSPGENN